MAMNDVINVTLTDLLPVQIQTFAISMIIFAGTQCSLAVLQCAYILSAQRYLSYIPIKSFFLAP